MSLRTPPHKPAVDHVSVAGTQFFPNVLPPSAAFVETKAGTQSAPNLLPLSDARIEAKIRCHDRYDPIIHRLPTKGSVVLSVLGPTPPKSKAVAGSIEGLAAKLAQLGVDQANTDTNTGKRKVDGSLAAARHGQTTTERWANERFRQTMLLVLEFRREWPGNSLLTADDVEAINTAVDNALYVATNSSHVADIYDMNPMVWAIWLVQRAHTLKVGAWTVESADAQQRLSFENLYRWLEQQHARRDRHDIRDPTTNKVIHRYVLAFKKMIVPPATSNLFKYRKGAQRLSEWIKSGSSDEDAVGLAQGIIDMQPAAIVAPPPGAARRNARANAAWGRARGAQQRRSRLRSVEGDSSDAQETRQVVDAVMQASRAVASTDSDDELVAELEREMEEDEGGSDGAGPSQAGGGVPLEDVQRVLMEDSDGEVESDGGRDGGGGSAQPPPPPQGDELSEYEKERQENIRRNEARLRELGLLDDPPAPARPSTVPRQPRPPRAPDGPRRASRRLQDLPRPPYADVEHSDDESAEG